MKLVFSVDAVCENQAISPEEQKLARERMGLSDGADGQVRVMAGGVPAWADQIAYAAGTFTPSLTFSGPGNLSVSYAKRIGRYTRIGNRVFCDVILWCTPTWTTSTGQAQVQGLPFEVPLSIYGDSANGEGMLVACATCNVVFPSGATGVFGRLNGGANTISFRGVRDGNSDSTLGTAQFPSGAAVRLSMNFCYEIE